MIFGSTPLELLSFRSERMTLPRNNGMAEYSMRMVHLIRGVMPLTSTEQLSVLKITHENEKKERVAFVPPCRGVRGFSRFGYRSS